jgi:hypothetical protein
MCLAQAPVERVWLYLEQRFLPMRLLDDYRAIVGRRIESLQAITPLDHEDQTLSSTIQT